MTLRIELGTGLYLYHIEKWNQVKEGVVDERTQKLFNYIEKEAKKNQLHSKIMPVISQTD